MKRFLNVLGVFVLLSFSLIYTEKTANAVRDLDSIMIHIRESALEKKQDPVEAIVTLDTIIPGINGREVDINRSYQNMRAVGLFNEKYLKFKETRVRDSLRDNKDKFIISGNQNKMEISLVFLVEPKTNIDIVLKTLRENDISGTFFIDGVWFERNNSRLYEIVSQNHSIGSIGYNYNYDNPSYSWKDTVIKKVSNKREGFCIRTDERGLEICAENQNYTIDPIIINTSPIFNTRSSLKNGALLAYRINNMLERDLNFILGYIERKGYKIVPLIELLEE